MATTGYFFMKPFLWDKHFITGVESIDGQHKKLIGLVNDFGILISTGNYVSKNGIENLLNELTDYTKYHFETEEQMMRNKKVDPRHLIQHCQDHQQFIKDIGMMYSQLSNGGAESASSLLEFLIYWLAYHILGTDQILAKQIHHIKAGMDPTDAYTVLEQDQENATEPLLNALNGLFKQVSERNQDLTKLNQTLEQKVDERTRELLDANRHLEQMALTDLLTKLPNRRHAMQNLTEAWQFSTKHNAPLSLIMIDADNFKQINDG